MAILEFKGKSDEDKELDDFILALGKAVQASESKPAVIDIENVKKVAKAYELVKQLTKGTKVKVEYHINEPVRSMGGVNIIGKNIPINDTELFMQVANLASNFNVYAKTNGTVEMDFTFHGLTKS